MAEMSSQGAGVALREQELIDASEQARGQSWIDFECCQVSSGPYSGRLSCLKVPDAELYVEEQNRTVHKFGRIPEGHCTVSVVSDAGSAGWFQSERLGKEVSVFLLPGGSDFDLYLPAHTRTLYIAFDFEELLSGLRVLEPRRWAWRPGDLQRIQAGGRASFIRAVFEMIELGRKRDLDDRLLRFMKHRLKQTALAALSGEQASEGEARDGHWRRAEVVRCAREFMHDSVAGDQRDGMVDLCRALGVSERSLQYSFREMMDTTPIAYWRVLKLNAARKRLIDRKAQPQSVTETAMQCGFLHLGRFARDYRLQFGESPSATLSRATRYY